MITLQEYKDELIPVNLHTPMKRSDYYKKYMDKGITIESDYSQLVRCDIFRVIDRFEDAWLHHESAHLK